MINGDHKGEGGPPQKPSSRPDGKCKAEKTPVKRPRQPLGPPKGGHKANKTASANAGGPISEAGPSSAPQARAYPGVQALPTPDCTWLAGGIRIDHPHPPSLANGRRSMNGAKISHRPPPPLWNKGRPTNGGPVDHTSPPRPRPRPPPPAEHDPKPKGSGGVDRRGPTKPGGPNGTFEVVLRGEMVFKTARRGFSHIGLNAIRRANRSRAYCRNPNHNRFGALSSMGSENGSDFSRRGSEDANDSPPANGGSGPDGGGDDSGSPSNGPQDAPGAAAAGDDGSPASVKGFSDHSDSGQDGSSEDYATDIEATVGQGCNSVTEVWTHMGRNVARLVTLGAILMTGLLQVASHAVSHLARRCYEGVGAVFGEARQHDEGSAAGRSGRSSGSNAGLLGARSRQQSRRRHGRATAVCRLPTLQELEDDTSRQDGEGEYERQPAVEAASRAPRSVREE